MGYPIPLAFILLKHGQNPIASGRTVAEVGQGGGIKAGAAPNGSFTPGDFRWESIEADGACQGIFSRHTLFNHRKMGYVPPPEKEDMGQNVGPGR